MGIRDIIHQRKMAFFVARDADKRELQKADLMREKEILIKERQETEAIRQLQREINKERAIIKEARTEGTRNIFNKLSSGASNIVQKIKQADEGRPRASIWDQPTFAEVQHPLRPDEHPFRPSTLTGQKPRKR